MSRNWICLFSLKIVVRWQLYERLISLFVFGYEDKTSKLKMVENLENILLNIFNSYSSLILLHILVRVMIKAEKSLKGRYKF